MMKFPSYRILLSATVFCSFSASIAYGDSLADAKKMVEQAKAQPIWQEAAAPIAVGQKLKGKRILWLQAFSSLPFWINQNEGYKAAMEAAGVSLTIVDPAGDLVKAARQIDDGIARKFDLIQLGDETPSDLAAPIRAAKEAGIPVNCMFARDPGPLSKTEIETGCTTVTTADYTAIGKLAAAAAFVMSNGDPALQAIAYNAPGSSGVADLETNGYLDQLRTLCPTCKVSQVDAPAGSWATDLGPLTTSLITANPKLSWLFPIYGGAVQFITPAIDAAGAKGRVRVGTQEDSTTAIGQVKSGDLAYTVLIPLEWLGLATADVAFRILLGQPTPDDVKVPLHLFDAENTKNIDVTAEHVDQMKWFGVDYRTPYYKGWGLTQPAR